MCQWRFWMKICHNVTRLSDALRIPYLTNFLYTGYTEKPMSISVRRVLLGGQQRATLSLSVTNHLNVSRSVGWLETMPWFINFYLHTMTVTSANGQPAGGPALIFSAPSYQLNMATR